MPSKLYYEDGYSVLEITNESGDIITIKTPSNELLPESKMRAKLDDATVKGPNKFFRPNYDQDIHGNRPQFITSPDVKIPKNVPPGARYDPIFGGRDGKEQGRFTHPDLGKL